MIDPLPLAAQLIRRFEGCRLKAYQDMRGIWTIGYGTTGSNICEGLEITETQADTFLHVYLTKILRQLDLIVKPLTANQEAALLSLIYNIGFNAFVGSTLHKCLLVQDMIGAAAEFLKWDHVAGKEVDGLKSRRQAERELFITE